MTERVIVNAFVTCYKHGGLAWEMTLVGTQPLPDAVIKEISGGKVHVQFTRRKTGVIEHRPWKRILPKDVVPYIPAERIKKGGNPDR